MVFSKQRNRHLVCGDPLPGIGKGERKQKCKRGFATKRVAQDWGQNSMQNAADMDMTFEAFYEIYTKDKKALAEGVIADHQAEHCGNKDSPLFRAAEDQRDSPPRCDCLAERAAGVSGRELIASYSQTSQDAAQPAQCHLQSRRAVLRSAGKSCIESRKYGQRGTPGDAVLDERGISEVAAEMMDKPVSYYAFEMLYWCGIREAAVSLTLRILTFKQHWCDQQVLSAASRRGCTLQPEN